MIEVFVYVTGLALLQIPGGCDPALRILLPVGGYESSVVDDLHVTRHATTASLLSGRPDLGVVLGDLVLRQASAKEGACAPPAAAQDWPNLSTMTGQRLKPACLAGALSNCRTAGRKKNALNARLTFTGNWTIEPMVKCMRPPFHRRPSPANETGGMVFVRATKPWLSYARGGSEPTVYEVGDTILVRALVSDVKPILTALGASPETPLLPKAACDQYTGLQTGGTECAIVVIGNAPPPEMKQMHQPAIGVADVHFAAVLDLLKAPVASSSYLPVPTAMGQCWDDGGGVRTVACSPSMAN